MSVGLSLTLAAASMAQIAQGGGYRLEQSIVAAGGASAQSDGNSALSVAVAIGQPAAGTTFTGAPFTVKSGFFTPEPFAPTAACVSISGRISTPEGSGLRNAQVILTDAHANARTAISSAFGYFRFAEVEAGQVYILTIVSKRYQFAPQALAVSEEIADLNLVAEPSGENGAARNAN